MWRKDFMAVFILLLSWTSWAQSSEDMDRIMDLIGCGSPEDIDGYEVERLSSYLERPLKLNLAPPSTLRSCGLFTEFQAVSLVDYRTRHGDILSYGELAGVDGFTDEVVRILSPFITLEGGSVVRDSYGQGRSDHDMSARGGLKFSGTEIQGNYGFKYRLTSGRGLSLSLAASSSNSETLDAPDSFSGYVGYDFGKVPLRLVLGDFNARFGQGLAFWNGMSMTGLSKAASFMKSASGISSSWSFTGSSAHTGLACEYAFSRFRLVSLVAFPGIRNGKVNVLPALNFGWTGKNMCASVTHYQEIVPMSGKMDAYMSDMKTATDVAMCLRGTDVFAEVAFDWVNMAAAVLAGTRFAAGEDGTMAAHLRFYPAAFNPSRSSASRTVSKCSNEYGASVCYGYSPMSKAFSCDVSLDSAYLPVTKEEGKVSVHARLLAEASIKISDTFSVNLRLSERYRTWGRNPFKTDVRADLAWSDSSFSVTGRLNVLNYIQTGFLTYVEGGYKTDKFSLHIRQMYFMVDEWDDRIYAYERDAPGNYSVPAFYGRGLNTALMLSWKFSRWGRLYLKGTMTTYPFMAGQKKKSGTAGLKLQSVFSF